MIGFPIIDQAAAYTNQCIHHCQTMTNGAVQQSYIPRDAYNKRRQGLLSGLSQSGNGTYYLSPVLRSRP